MILLLTMIESFWVDLKSLVGVYEDNRCLARIPIGLKLEGFLRNLCKGELLEICEYTQT